MKNFDDFDFEDLENKKIHWDYKNLKESGVDFWTIFLLRVAPLAGIFEYNWPQPILVDFAKY